ncbi:MAG: DUF4382 domain-containing protein [Candidatus Velthaea sp.]
MRKSPILLLCLALAACGGGGGGYATAPAAGTAQFSASLIDAPFSRSGISVTAVNLAIDKIEVVGNGSAPTVVQSFATPQIINILSYASAANAFPVGGSIPAGSYSQIRLLLDTAGTTISYTDSSGTHTNVPLSIPSATSPAFGSATTDTGDGPGTAGVKVNVALNAISGGTYAFIIDFNALNSIVVANGSFIMKPVLVATAVATAGTLGGTVTNKAGTAVANAEVQALQNGAVVNSSVTAANGSFTINALPAGTYSLVVLNGSSTTGADTSAGASLSVPGTFTVTAGQATSAGTIAD